jgi:hypothetical protein
MVGRLLIVILSMVCMGCNGTAQSFIVYQGTAAPPAIVAAEADAQPAVDAFINVFEKATGVKPLRAADAEDGTVIELAITKDLNNNGAPAYTIRQDKNTVRISGTDISQLYAATQYFFAEYAGVYANQKYSGNKNIKIISLPMDLDYTSAPAFEYREPYFPENFNAQYRQWNNTQTIDDTWGLWGHNIGKAVSVTPAMLALVDGKRTEEQFCFSSPELQEALESFIERQLQANAARSKFMIMPNDNALVCQCGSCRAKGNTKTNASPAVFTLLNAIAGKFREQQFFSTAYMSTQHPPKFKLSANTGVMISTMQFPKGVVIADSNKKPEVEEVFSGWQKVADKIYLWDYAVNYDNYFDFYPTVSVAQQNLKFYKANGVTGVFMHGSEEVPSAFSGLKSYLYAQLLQNPDIDIKKHTKLYLDSAYPSVSALLSDYYLGAENKALSSRKLLDIYGGIVQSQKKYLDYGELNRVYNQLSEKYGSLNTDEQSSLAPTLAAMAFQLLEINRTNGFEHNGYADINDANHNAAVKKATAELLKSLKQYCDVAGITVYNESGFTVAGYLQSWETEITGKPYRNLFYAKKFKMLSKPDEDYPNVKMLNDGNIGFNDYYNNWLIQTANTISLQVNADDVKGTEMIELSFLNDPRHKIYLPEVVVVTIGSQKYEGRFTVPKGNAVSKHRISIPVTIKPGDKEIIIKALKQNPFKDKSVACDEIYFR